MKHRPFVLLDIETTGGSARNSRITEIGALRIEDGKVAATFSQLVNPEENIPYFITRLTGITNEMTWEAPTFRGIADELEVFLDDAIFVAHNVNFDYSFIQAEFKRIGIDYKSDRICSARLSRRLYPEQRRHGLDYVVERLGIDVTNRHRAYDDAEVIWKFFQYEIAKNETELFRHINKLVTYKR